MMRLSIIELELDSGLRLECSSAVREESLGVRTRWQLHVSTPAVLENAKTWRLSQDDQRRTLLKGRLKIRDDAGDELTSSGPFRVLRIEETVRGHVVTLEQTVEDAGSLKRLRYLQHLPDGDLQSWCNTGPLGSMLLIQSEVMNLLDEAANGLPSLVSCIDQTHVDLAAWLAWAATYDLGCFDSPFWIIGRQGKTWQLIKDDPNRVLDVGSDWRMINWQDRTAPESFVSFRSPSRTFRYDSSEPLTVADRLFTRGFLPYRLNLCGDHLRVVSRIDTFAMGPVAWQVELHASEQPPLPIWHPPEFDTDGKLLGEVAESWTSGEFVNCRIPGSPAVFPVRLTTFDSGQGQATGWQWVPSQGNRICIDLSWSMRTMPAIRYVERVGAVQDPYSSSLPSNASWITRLGNRVIRFVKEGVQIE